MLHASLDAPTIPGLGVEAFAPDCDTDRAAQEVSRLLMGVRMARQRSTLFKMKLGEQRPRSMREGLEHDTRQSLSITGLG